MYIDDLLGGQLRLVVNEMVYILTVSDVFSQIRKSVYGMRSAVWL